MSLLPRHSASRRAAWLWLLACIVTLAVMLLRPGLYEGDRNALAALVPLYFLSLPLGHAGVLADIQIRTALYLAGAAPGMLAEGVLQWLTLAVLGYVQWFLLLPLIARKCQQALQFLFNRDGAKGRAGR